MLQIEEANEEESTEALRLIENSVMTGFQVCWPLAMSAQA